MPLYFEGLPRMTCSAPVVDIGLHFVPDKPMRDTWRVGGLQACESP